MVGLSDDSKADTLAGGRSGLKVGACLHSRKLLSSAESRGSLSEPPTTPWTNTFASPGPALSSSGPLPGLLQLPSLWPLACD